MTTTLQGSVYFKVMIKPMKTWRFMITEVFRSHGLEKVEAFFQDKRKSLIAKPPLSDKRYTEA